MDLPLFAAIFGIFSPIRHVLKIFLQEKAVEATKQKEEKRKKPRPEEQEGKAARHVM
jgi:hypothetical protein